MCSDVVLSARHVSKAFTGLERPMRALAQAYSGGATEGAQMILCDISFDLHRGEAIGIIGRNGAGKSTLLKIVSGVMRPSHGTVERKGRLAAMLELGAAFNPDFTGRENVRFVARVLGLAPDAVEGIIDPVRDFADIGPFFDRRVAEYSSGMFARLAFAVNLHSDPDIFIIDEALAVGDTLFQFKCFAHLEQFRARGGTLLLVTHDENAVRSLCDRAIWLDKGRMMADGKADHVCGLYAATSAIAGGGGARLQGGRDDTLDAPAPEALPPRLDPDSLPPPSHPGSITALRAYQAGRAEGMLEGGREAFVTFRYDGPARPMMRGMFLFRDRMAQTIFAGTLPLHGAQELRFRFDLPFVPTGEYVIEALVLEGEGDAPRLIDKSPPYPVSMATKHISGGLANLKMNAVTIRHFPDPAAMS